jgi:hypothetical protein
MAKRKEPNYSAFHELLCSIGPQYLVGVPAKLKDYVAFTSEETDDFLVGDSNTVDTLEDCWLSPDYTPEEAVKEVLDVWLENVKGAIWGDPLIESEYGGDSEKVGSIAAGIKFVNLQELIDRLVKAAMTPSDEMP